MRTRWMAAGLVMLALAATAWPQSTGSEAAGVEQQLFRLANRARAQAGLPELEWNEWLAQAARQHAEEMARRGRLSHQFPGEPGLAARIAATALRFDATAENVGFAPTASEIHDDWMHSPPHRANILDATYNAMGVAVVRDGDRLYAVTDFAHTVPTLSASELEDAVAAAINQVREQKNLRPLSRRQDAQLRHYACQMAGFDHLSANELLGRPGVSASLAFTEPDPAHFIAHFRNVANVTTSRAFAVGACPARSKTYPEGTNWVVVAFY